MADELVLELEDTQEVKQDKRIKDLSEKVRLTSQERDEKDKLVKEKDEQLVKATKELDFFNNFSPLTTKYAGAADFKDKIKEKVLAGYDVEDATVAVLAKEGKLTTPVEEVPKENPAGGSAVNTIKGAENKPLNEKTREERKAALEEAIAKGDISLG